MFWTSQSESCFVKAPAKHASESVPVVSELLCTGVQANTERDTNQGIRVKMCLLMLGNKQHSSSRQSGEWRDIKTPTELAQGSYATTLALIQSERTNYFTGFKEVPSFALRINDFKLTRDETGDRLSRTRTT